MAKENLIFSIIYKGAAASLVLRIKVLAIKLSKRMGYKPFIVQPYRRIDGAIMITFFHVYDSSINISELQRGGPCELSVSSKREEWVEIRPAWWELAKGLIQDGKIEESALPEWLLEEYKDMKLKKAKEGLSERNIGVLNLWIVERKTEEEISEELNITISGVAYHKKIIKRNIRVKGRRKDLLEIIEDMEWNPTLNG